ncbi:unnamed protein product [Ceutorhynchus assimilis]|uniref:Tubulin/FtsZ GTPase domain-containing protein n=1 Tax=Ceutorhynchus assimilis TaxID=467358 RepID=A0A9N9N0V2_9CUCU|nr:unnamed protein product [Ceutorhynchus assimilis]
MSEFIVIQVGQCGNQIGSALWPKILQEYDVSLKPKPHNKPLSNQESFSSFFNVPPTKTDNSYNSLQELVNNKVKARAVCIDMEDGVVARFRNGVLKGLFEERCMVTNYPGSGNNWAEGFCEHGPQYQEKILKSLRHSIERCDSLHGFLMLFSTGGGTGSGLGTFVLNILSEFYPKIERFVSCVYATGTEDVITSPYNNALATHQILENATCVFPVENRCLLEIVARKHKNGINEINMFNATDDMNSSIVDMLLHLTSGSRFSGTLNFDMNDINTNMVPYPKMNFISTGFNHLVKSSLIAKNKSKQLKEEMFLASCNRQNQLIQIDPLSPKSLLLSSTLIGRGDYTITDLQTYIDKLQSKAKFTAWSKKSIKVGLCNVPPNGQTVALFSLFNTTAMYSLFEHLYKQYNSLYRKRAHIHHYTKINNFDIDFFEESKESLQDMMQKYTELENQSPLNIPRLTPQ